MRFVTLVSLTTFAVLSLASSAFAQESLPPPQGTMQMPMPASHQHQSMSMGDNPLGIAENRDGSGTSWLPDSTPAHGVMRMKGPWMLMLHGNGFVEFTKAGSPRGDDQVGSVNWIMGMAQRALGGGRLQARAMFSAEPATIGRCGYPALAQSGEFCRGTPLHDRQHPHDLFMEIAADYRRAVNSSLAFEIYGGPSAEPALGPTAYPHRLSAMPNLVASIAHHWLDSTHISFGVITGGVYGKKWKAETSLFNGREPDDGRYNIDLAPLDSYSGRLWWLPTPSIAAQVSAGHLREAEFRPDGPRQDVDRITASVTYHRVIDDKVWATTIAWGQNRETHHSTSALTAETAVDVTRVDVVFARGEIVGKTATELVLPVSDDRTFDVAKLQLGYTRWLMQGHGVRAGIGGAAGLAVVPIDLEPFYGGRTAGEFSVFLAIRPH